MKLPRLIFAAALFVSMGLVANSFAAEPRVEAKIEIPVAESYVLGDDIPLIWEFTNLSTNPVAMLWEGCCRLNGKLDISSEGQSVEILPPGAAAFHSFSKAAELEPNTPNKFSSLLSDWVKIPRGGTFDIGGRYTGVLPTQSPQVPDGLELWKGTAVAEAVGFSVLSVAEYLDQQESRSRQRGVRLNLVGPATLPAVDLISVSLTIENLSAELEEIAWPGTMQLWIVDQDGFRLAQGTKHIRQPGEYIALQPGQSATREFAFSSSDLNGAPFGKYQVFLDFGETETGVPRVPSNAIEVDWNLSKSDLVQLLNDASGGPSVGMRNPSLKLLRLYLGEINPLLQSISPTSLNAKAIELKEQLELASCVEPISPKPGIALLPVELSALGNARVRIPDGASCGTLSSQDGVKQLESVYSIRRHLGWDLQIEIIPEIDAPVDSVFEFAGRIENSNVRLASPLMALFRGDSGLTNTVQFPAQAPSGNVAIRIRPGLHGEEVIVAAVSPDPRKPAWMNMISTEKMLALDGEPVPLEGVVAWVRDRGVMNPQAILVVEGPVQWGAFTQILSPLFELSPTLNVVRR